MNTILGKEYSAHDATEDVMPLHELFSKERQKHCWQEDVHSSNYHIQSALKSLVDKKIIIDAIFLKVILAWNQYCTTNTSSVSRPK